MRKRSVKSQAVKKVGIIIQARMGSKRLPGKSLMPLAGQPVVGRCIERAKGATLPELCVLAIPDTAENECLKRVANDRGAEIFQGPEDDLVERYYQAAIAHKIDIIVRIPADNPCPEPWLIDHTIRYHMVSGNDFTSSYPDGLFRTFPEGMGCEVYNLETMAFLRENMSDPEFREHPHKGIYANPGMFRIGAPPIDQRFHRADMKLHINTSDEYSLMCKLYDDLFCEQKPFGIECVIAWWDRHFAGQKA